MGPRGFHWLYGLRPLFMVPVVVDSRLILSHITSYAETTAESFLEKKLCSNRLFKRTPLVRHVATLWTRATKLARILKIQNGGHKTQNKRDKGSLIFYSYSKWMWGLPARPLLLFDFNCFCLRGPRHYYKVNQKSSMLSWQRPSGRYAHATLVMWIFKRFSVGFDFLLLSSFSKPVAS